jgi:hypothetical protein
MLDAAKQAVDKLGGDGDAARDRILELANERGFVFRPVWQEPGGGLRLDK